MNNAQLYVLATRLEQIERARQFSGQIPTRRSLRHHLRRMVTLVVHLRRRWIPVAAMGRMSALGEDVFSQQRPPDEPAVDVHRYRE